MLSGVVRCCYVCIVTHDNFADIGYTLHSNSLVADHKTLLWYIYNVLLFVLIDMILLMANWLVSCWHTWGKICIKEIKYGRHRSLVKYVFAHNSAPN